MKAARERLRPVSETELQFDEYKKFGAKDVPHKLN